MSEFEKIKGYKSVKVELERICDILKNTEKYSKLGVVTPGGLLLYGEPGVGKTLMANCLIKESGRKSFVCRKDKPNGDFVKEIKNIYLEASLNTPSIVFLDDMDKFANEDQYHKNAEEYVTIQSCIDEYKNKDIFTLATANDIDHLPNSLIRVGRFDKKIEIDNPKNEDAIEILSYYLSKKNNVQNIDATLVAKILNGSSCAELETVINEAGLYAGFEGKEYIDMDDIVKSCLRVIFKAPESLSKEEESVKELIAYHEAGHTIISEILEPGSINIVSITKYDGEIGGLTSHDNTDQYWFSKKLMENRVITLLGGKASTETVFGETDVGANDDIHRAVKIVKRFIDNYASYGFSTFEFMNDSSNTMISRKEDIVLSEVSRYYNTAKSLIVKNRGFLDAVANALMEKQTLLANDLAEIKKDFQIKM